MNKGKTIRLHPSCIPITVRLQDVVLVLLCAEVWPEQATTIYIVGGLLLLLKFVAMANDTWMDIFASWRDK